MTAFFRKVYVLGSSSWFALIPFAAALLAVTTGETGLVCGARFLAVLLAVTMAVYQDVMVSAYSFFMLIALGVAALPNPQLLMAQWPFAIAPLTAIVVHALRWPKHFRPGKSFYGLLCASAAVILGGLGSISAREYFDPTAIGYVAGLSLGLLLVYYFFAGSCQGKEADRLTEQFLLALLLLGTVCAVLIVIPYIRVLAEYFRGARRLEDLAQQLFFLRNQAGNLLVMTMPAPFYFAIKKGLPRTVKCGAFLLGCGFYFVCLICMSRSALLFGTVQVVLCILYCLYQERDRVAKRIYMLLLLLGTVVAYILFWDKIMAVLNVRLEEGLIKDNEIRVLQIMRSFQDFLRNPLFGVGLGYQGNADLYSAPGCIGWYHSYFPQIWGSLGLVGMALMGTQLWLRLKIMLRHRDRRAKVLSLVYIGLFLYSQTDPGEFCPVPYEVIAVMSFAVLECRPVWPNPESGDGKRLNSGI